VNIVAFLYSTHTTFIRRLTWEECWGDTNTFSPARVCSPGAINQDPWLQFNPLSTNPKERFAPPATIYDGNKIGGACQQGSSYYGYNSLPASQGGGPATPATFAESRNDNCSGSECTHAACVTCWDPTIPECDPRCGAMAGLTLHSSRDGQWSQCSGCNCLCRRIGACGMFDALTVECNFCTWFDLYCDLLQLEVVVDDIMTAFYW
jgi:hypothetical protein